MRPVRARRRDLANPIRLLAPTITFPLLRRNIHQHAARHLQASGASQIPLTWKAVILLSLASLLGLGQFVASEEVPHGVSPSTTKSSAGITVRIYNYARVPRQLLDRAERETYTIFVKAGIEVEMVDCPLTGAETALYPACQRDLGAVDFVLNLLPECMARRAKLQDTTLGFARLSSDGERSYVAGVFWDRITEAAHGGDLSASQLLGHAAAHEIGHLLLGSIGHARTGLMSASWGPSELKAMAQGAHLLFTARQCQRMRAAMLARMRWQQFGAPTFELARQTH